MTSTYQQFSVIGAIMPLNKEIFNISENVGGKIMNELQIVEYNDVRVVTTKQLANVYGVETKIIRNNFNRNKKRYVEGKHYFLLTGDKKREFVNRPQIEAGSKNAKNLYLWTERGALLHAKSINTDVAWDAYERLIDFYFQKKAEFKNDFPFIEETTRHRVPLVKDWYERNKERLRRICFKTDIEYSELYHHILVRLGERFDLKAANEIYKEETGDYPKYAIDIVRYFPELDEAADYYLDRVERHFWR